MHVRYVNVDHTGGPEVLQVQTRESVPPGATEATVRVLAAGVSGGDILFRAGAVPVGLKPPYTPGFDVTGVVEEVGREVSGLHAGQLVTALINGGGYSEVVTLPAERLVPVPDGLDPVDVAALSLNHFIAQQMIHRVAGLKAGQRALVHGASGGVGTAMLQLARLAELECYGTASAANRDKVVEYGARYIDYRSDDFVQVLRAAGGADAVFDPIGGTYFFRSYRALRRGGILVGYGQSQVLRDGKVHTAVGALGLFGGIGGLKLIPDHRRTRFYNTFSLEKKAPQAYREDLTTVLRLFQEGKIRPVIAEVLPLDQATAAHELLERPSISGKVVLTCAEQK